MKIISLNIWGGRGGDDLLEFFRKYSDVDIFLLQEVFHNATANTVWHPSEMAEAFKEIGKALPNHNGHFAPAQNDEWGLALFIKKEFRIEEIGDVFVYREKDAMIGKDGATLGKNIQYVKTFVEDKKITVINFHGLWNGKGKTDTEDRIGQSKMVIDFIKKLEGDVVLSGDFNLRPDTESLKMIEREVGLKNLILEHGITSTRTSLYDKEEKFADYILLTPSIKVKDFRVLPDEVSDHTALFLEF